MLIRPLNAPGFTLIEVLISLFLGSLLLAMIIGLYVANVTAGAKAQKHSRLRTDMQALVGIISDDIRRASYGGSEFMVGADSNKVIDTINNSSEQCIVYAYNYNNADEANTQHIMGFRYSSSNHSVQFANGVDKQAERCFDSGPIWKNLTDPSAFKVTSLTFVESQASSAHATIRSVDIRVAGELIANSEYRHQVHTRVQVRNMEFDSTD